MKQIKSYIPGGLLLLATLFPAASAQADAPSYITCGDYVPEGSVERGGHVEATLVGGCWQITAVPDRGWRFVKWADNENTNPVRSLSLDLEDKMDSTFVANFTRVVYNNCFSSSEFSVKDETALETERGTISYRQLMDDSYELTATPKSGYTFVQWSDGSYANPRVIESISSADKDVSFYATFMSTTPAQAVIDSWSNSGFKMIAEPSQPITSAGLSGGAITVFYDGDVAFCGLPTARKTDDGTYTVSIPYSADLAGKKCHIVYKNSDHEPLATLDAYVPVLVSGNTNVVVPNSNTGVHVLDGGVATFATGQTLAELEIYSGGKAIVSAADTVTVSSITVHRDGPSTLDSAYASPSLAVVGAKLKNGNSNKVYFDYALDYDCYYPFAVPYTVNSSNVTYRSGHSADNHYVVNWYDGDARANGLSAWKPYYDVDYGYPGPVDFVGGCGYNIFSEPETWNGVEQDMYGGVIRFPMTVDLKSGETAVKSVSVQKHESADMAKRNWNLIGLPYLSHYTGYIYLAKDGVALEDDEHNPRILQYVSEPKYGFTDYSQEYVGDGDFTLNPFQAYFIQFNTDVQNDVNELLFDASASGGHASAPRKRAAAITSVTNKLKAGITLSQNGSSDHTGLFIGEQYTDNYDLNADLAKMIGKTSRVKLYSLSGSQKLAYIAIPPAEGTGTLETVIPLGYDSAAVGQNMTFAMDARRYPRLLEDENIYELNLIDNEKGVTTNLLENAYTCKATKRTDNTRFSLGIVYRAPQQQEVATGCEEIRATALPDGIYDLMGRRIHSDNARNAGVYIIIENGKARKEVIR